MSVQRRVGRVTESDYPQMDHSAEAQRLISEHTDWLGRPRAGHRAASERTVADRERILRFADRHLPNGLIDVDEKQIAELLASPGWSPWTRWTYDTALRVFYGWAALKGKMSCDPMGELPKPAMPVGLPRPMRDEHLAVLMRAPWPIPLVTALGRYQGLRLGEIAGLRREDITAETTFIRRAKGGQPASVPTHPDVWAMVADLPAGPLILGARTGLQVTAKQLGDVWRLNRIRLGLPAGVVSHRNRHRFGTDLRRATNDLLVTSRAMRHRRLETTRIYTEVTADELAAAIRLLGAEPGSDRLSPRTA
jgi:integrase